MKSSHPQIRSKQRWPRWRLARAWGLALMLICANAIASWSMVMPAEAVPSQAVVGPLMVGNSAHAHAQGMAKAHHCDESGPHALDDPGAGHDHSHLGGCPCCDHGCQCLHSTGAPTPTLLVLRSVIPSSAIVARAWTMPASPVPDEQLRPPIA